MYDFQENVYDIEEGITYIARHTNIPEEIVKKVLEVEIEYMKTIGLIEEY